MAQAARKKEVAPESKVDPKASVKQTKPKYELSAEHAAIIEHLDGPSLRIRFLLSEGLTRSQIRDTIPNARGGELLYQHVYNVEKQGMSEQRAKEYEALVAAAKEAAGIKKSK